MMDRVSSLEMNIAELKKENAELIKEEIRSTGSKNGCALGGNFSDSTSLKKNIWDNTTTRTIHKELHSITCFSKKKNLWQITLLNIYIISK